MQTIDQMFADYAAYHRTPGNKAMHRLGIPMIMFSLFGLLAQLTLGTAGPIPLDAAVALIVVSTIFYVRLEWRLALAMLLVSVAMYLVARTLPLSILWPLFIAGWIFQFIGHGVYEKKQPAFARNLVHLLIGPLWILNDVIPVVRPARN